MRLAFVDFIYHYDAARPDTDEALGGTTSAICFLAREMVAAGITPVFYNKVREPCSAHGIETWPLQTLSEAVGADAFDAYIFCGRWTQDLVGLVRAHTKKPLIGWMHESIFVEPMTPALDAFDGMVFVSEWQRRVNQHLAKPHWRQTVIRNAMNPRVADSFLPDSNILAAKSTPPILLYAGSFARGAFHIPTILDKLRLDRDDFTVEMFCNLDPSRDAEKDATYISWLRNQPNIAHIGMVGQSELARRMKRASIFLAPNPWPETSCIALIEALASGMTAITTNRAALPETASGFARHIPINNADDQTRFDMPVDADAFAKMLLNALQERDKNLPKTEADLRRQIAYFHGYYQWKQRVASWASFIKYIL